MPGPFRLRHPNTVTVRRALRGIFMLTPKFVCTVCGSDDLCPSSTPLPAPLRAMGLAPFRCRACECLVPLPFRVLEPK